MSVILKVALAAGLAFALALFVRVFAKPTRGTKQMFVLGSGGHTREMMHLLSVIQPENPVFVHADSDSLSKDLVSRIYEKAPFVKIARARQVKQSYFTAVFSTLKAIREAFGIIYEQKPHLIVTNGPGTALPLIVAAWTLRHLNYVDCRVVFVESYCRIFKLSVTGKLCKFLVDEFVVNWPQLQGSGAKYIEVYPK